MDDFDELTDRINLRVSEGTRDAIDEFAQQMQISRGQLVRDAIKIHIRDWESFNGRPFYFLKKKGLGEL